MALSTESLETPKETTERKEGEVRHIVEEENKHESQGKYNIVLKKTKKNTFVQQNRRQNDEDTVENSMYDAMQGDASCTEDDMGNTSCTLDYDLPESTIEAVLQIDATCSYGGDDPDSDHREELHCRNVEDNKVDRHWGSDPKILRMRDRLRLTGSGCALTSQPTTAANNTSPSSSSTTTTTESRPEESNMNRRPPIILMPGLASTRLVAWRFKSCKHLLHSDIRVQDFVWLNIQLIMQMSTIDVSCMSECLRLGRNQTDMDDLTVGCKLRPADGLDAISSLAPGGVTSQILVGGTNTVYAWLIQWLADNLGYDVSNIVGLPYDWRLSPDKMEQRDGFLTLTRRRIEAAVQSSGEPAIMVCHSMGNSIFRYFLQWLRTELQREAYDRYIRNIKRRAKAKASSMNTLNNILPMWMNANDGETEEDVLETIKVGKRHEKLWELGQMEGEDNWYEWIETHIWTYVGLSAPLLGAPNPLRAVISGENMGLPVSDADARTMELTFGSTHTVNTVSSKSAFCDQWDIIDSWDEESSYDNKKLHADSKLACLDDILTEIEIWDEKNALSDAWETHPALKRLLRDRYDWDSDIPLIRVIQETCEEKEKSPCARNSTIDFGPKDVETAELFQKFSEIWRENGDPLGVKREQLRESFWDNGLNILNSTWERPLIKHVIMAYGVDVPTEIGFEYLKTNRIGEDLPNFDGVPLIRTAYWEKAGGKIDAEVMNPAKGRMSGFWKKPKRGPERAGKLHHSGDGSVPYLSLAWAHTWLLHAVRAQKYSEPDIDVGSTNPLDAIVISHRPEGEMTWVAGPPPKRIRLVAEKKVEESSDTGTAHPHGTRYKPEMVRYHSHGRSRTTGMEYTTSVIEAVAVEHKETTRYVKRY